MRGSQRWVAVLAGAGLVALALLTVRLRAEVVVEGIRLGRSSTQADRNARRLDHATLVAETQLARMGLAPAWSGAVTSLHAGTDLDRSPTPIAREEVARP